MNLWFNSESCHFRMNCLSNLVQSMLLVPSTTLRPLIATSYTNSWSVLTYLCPFQWHLARNIWTYTAATRKSYPLQRKTSVLLISGIMPRWSSGRPSLTLQHGARPLAVEWVFMIICVAPMTSPRLTAIYPSQSSGFTSTIRPEKSFTTWVLRYQLTSRGTVIITQLYCVTEGLQWVRSGPKKWLAAESWDRMVGQRPCSIFTRFGPEPQSYLWQSAAEACSIKVLHMLALSDWIRTLCMGITGGSERGTHGNTRLWGSFHGTSRWMLRLQSCKLVIHL